MNRTARVVTVACLLSLLGLILVAVRQPGFTQVRPTAPDRSIWLHSAERALIGRADLASARLDSALAVKGAVELVQDQLTGAVAVHDRGAHELQLVDPALVVIGARITVPDLASVAMNGGRIAVADEATGRLWVAPADHPERSDLRSATPVTTLGPGAAVTVAPSGTVYAVAAGSDRLVTIGRDDRPVTTALPGGRLGRDPDELELTTVGDRPVIWDHSTGILRTAEVSFAVNGLATGRLQVPGPDRPDVLIATAQGLSTVDLTDGQVRTPTRAQGAPARPAVTENGCRVGIFGTIGVVSCPDVDPVSRDLAVVGVQLVRRGPDVVVQDDTEGRAWLATEGFREVTGWDQVAPPEADDRLVDSTVETDTDATPPPPPNCAGVPVGRPRAADDKFAIRAGRATVLRVLDNDPATDCTAVVITAVTGLPADLGAVAVVDGGTALQLTLTDKAAGALPPLEYRVDNGKGAQASAKVAVTVAPPGEHRAPQRIRRPVTEVEAGGTVSYDVLADYRSPTGDDLYLASAGTESADEVGFRADGTITLHSTGTGVGGNHTVDFVVSDGHDQVRGTLTVGIAPPGSTTPVSFPVRVSGTAGSALTADPVRAIGSGAVRAVTIGTVTPEPGSVATSTVDPVTGHIVVRSDKPGSYYFTFQATTGERATTGVLRADFAAPGEAGPAVPMVDLAYLTPGGSLLLDPLANDSDPGGAGLALQRVTIPEAVQGLSAAVVDLHQARLQAPRLTGPATVGYTVYDGANLVDGQIRIVPVPATRTTPPPVATGISAVVRAGDAVTIPLDGHAVSQDGSALTAALDPVEVAAVPGVLFTDGAAIRYLAPPTVPDRPVTFTYTAVSARSTPTAPVRASATVTVTVQPLQTAGDRPPSVPTPVVARVFVGGTIDVELPVDGIDPDGDWVRATGLLPPAAPLGKATLSGSAALRYTALEAPGIDRLEYTITDPFGRTAVGTVIVIVVPALQVAAPPVAPDLLAAVQPGRTIRISPLAAALDPAGGTVAFAEPAYQAPAGFRVTRDRDSLLVTAPNMETVATMRYSVRNGQGLTATGAIGITVSATATAPPPTAEDILVPPTDLGGGTRAVAVDIGGHVQNRVGRAEDLKLSVEKDFATARVTGPTTVTVKLTERRQVVPYRVTDSAGGSATAFLVIPPARQLAGPQLIGGKDLVRVDAGRSVDIAVADYVTVAVGAPRLAAGAALRASQGTATRLDDARVRLTMPTTAGGPAVLYLPIDTPGSAPTVLPLAVQVIPRVVPAPRIDAAELPVEVGTSAALDLAPLTTTFDSVQRSALRWSIRTAPEGVTVSLAGSVLTAAVPITADRGSTVTVPVQVTAGDGQTATTAITVRATGSRQPLPVVSSRRIPDARPGQHLRIDLLEGSSDPIGRGLTVTGVRPTAGAAGLAAGPDLSGSTVLLRVASGFSSDIELSFTVSDATGDPQRQVSGTLSIGISDRPGKPGTPTVVDGSRTATSVALSWAAADPHGSAVTGYTVAGGPEPAHCDPAAGSCRITGLVPGRPYTFTVTARNAVGESDPSPPSATVTPDAAPGKPAAPRAEYVARGTISVSFSAPAGGFSAVRTLELAEFTDGRLTRVLTDPENPVRVTGLDPAKSYTYRVRAINADGAGPWSDPSVPVVPSGVPGAPEVRATYTYDGSTGRIEVDWTPPADSGGEAITGYRIFLDGKQAAVVAGAARSADLPAGGIGERQIRVQAENPRGAGTPGTASVSVFTRPTPPDRPTVTGIDRALQLSWSGGSTPGGTVGHYDYRIDGGAWISAGTDAHATTPAELTNGRTYSVQVRVCNAATGFDDSAVCSPASAPGSGVPSGPLPDPTVTAAADGKIVTVSWSWPATDRGVTSRQVVITDENANPIATPNPATGQWSGDVGWGRTVVATVGYCVAGPVACAQARGTATTLKAFDMVLQRAGCRTPSPQGGDWPDEAGCEEHGGRWVAPPGAGTVTVIGCVKGPAYPADPADHLTTTAVSTVPTTVRTTVTGTSTDPGPPPVTSTVTTTSRIPTSTVVTVTGTLPAGDQARDYYQDLDGGYYRTGLLAGTGPPCR